MYTGGYDPEPTISLWESKRKKSTTIKMANCSQCKSIVNKVVMIVETNLGFDDRITHYCKSCFKKEFVNK